MEEKTIKQPEQKKKVIDKPILGQDLVCQLCAEASFEVISVIGSDYRTLLLRCTVCHKIETVLLAHPLKPMKPIKHQPKDSKREYI